MVEDPERGGGVACLRIWRRVSQINKVIYRSPYGKLIFLPYLEISVRFLSQTRVVLELFRGMYFKTHVKHFCVEIRAIMFLFVPPFLAEFVYVTD